MFTSQRHYLKRVIGMIEIWTLTTLPQIDLEKNMSNVLLSDTLSITHIITTVQKDQ